MAAGEELASEISLDASDFSGGAADAADASEDLAGSSEDLSESLWEIDAAGLAAGGAVAGVGTAAQEALDDSQDWRETLGRTAESTELTRDETTKLAQDLSNATFPMDDATKTMDILARQGVDTAEGLEETANTADLVADATGTTAEAVAENAGPALAAFGDDITDLEDHQDTLTHVSRNTTQSVEDFTKFIGKNREEIEDLGLSMDDTAGIIEHLEDQGYEGREAVRKFRQEANDADGDMEAFSESIDLSEEGLEDYKGEIAESEGVTEDMAEAANESTTAMDTVNDTLDDAKLAAGEMLGPVSAIAPAMQTAGIAAMAMSTINMSAVVPSLVSVATAAAPVVIPLLAIAAAVGALYYAFDNNLFGVRDIAMDVFDRLKQLFAGFKTALGGLVDWVKLLLSGDFSEAWTQAKQAVVDIVTGLGTRIKTIVTDTITGIVEWVKSLGKDDLKAAFKAIGSGIRTVVLGYFGLYKKIGQVVVDFISAIGTYLKEDAKADLKAAAGAAWEGIKTAISAGIAAITPSDGLVVQMIGDVAEYLKNDAVDDLKAAAGAAWGGIMAAATGLYEGLIGKSLIPDMISDIGSYLKNDAASDLKDAAKDAAQAMWDGLKDKFNSLTPPPISIPTKTIGGKTLSTGSVGIPGTNKRLGPASLNIPSKSIGGQSLTLPSLQSGGRIEREGLAMLHAGENVVPAAEVDRDATGSEHGEEIVRVLRSMRRDVRALGEELDVDVTVEGGGRHDPF